MGSTVQMQPCGCKFLPNQYSIKDVKIFSICLFVKAPLEAIDESVGSVISRHGNKASASMKADHLANEIYVS